MSIALSVVAAAAAVQAAPPPPPPESAATQPALPPQLNAAPDAGAPNPLVAEIDRVGETATVVMLTIADDGTVSACAIAEASASAMLDAEACRILTNRARFARPGRDDLRSRRQRIVWRIEGQAWRSSVPAPERRLLAPRIYGISRGWAKS